MIDVLGSELRYVKDRLQHLTDEQVRFIREELPALVLDALDKVERTRARDRIARIGIILAHSIVDNPVEPTDTIEELTRIAMSLEDGDVAVLVELVRGQRPAFSATIGRVDDESANNYWASGDHAKNAPSQYELDERTVRSKVGTVAQRLQITEGELQSRCAKLQSHGLIMQAERNKFKNPVGLVPYTVLTRGIEFVDAIHSFAGSEHRS